MRTARLVLFGIGVALAIAGFVNLVWPGPFFFSQKTCVQESSDLIVCTIYPWAAAPLVAVVGIALMALAVLLNRRGNTTG